MKKGITIRIYCFITSVFAWVLIISTTFAQSPVYFSSGNFANPNNWAQGSATAMGAIVGTNIHITTPNGTSNQYFRFYSATSGGTVYEPNGASDIQLTHSVSSALEVTGSGKAYFLNIVSTSSNVVFKTIGLGAPGSSAVVAFEVQGAIQTVSAVSQSPLAASVYPGQAVTVTASTSGTTMGQDFYLRYSLNGYATSTVVKMTGGPSSYSAQIPASANNASGNLSYYVFSSGSANVAADGSNADFFTINLDNNGGSNYSYTVQAGWTTAQAGNWNTAATWMANAVPSTTVSMGTVNVGHNVTLNQNASMSTLNVNAGTFTTSGTSTLSVTGTATIANGATYTNSSTLASQISMANFVVNNGGTYIHDAYGTGNGSASDFPGSSWTFGSTSNVLMTKWATTGATAPTALPAVGGLGFGNLTISLPAFGGSWNQVGNLTNIQGNLNITSTGGTTREFRLTGNQAGSTTVGGSISITGGYFAISSGNQNYTLIVSGNMTINGPTAVFKMSSGSASTPTITAAITGSFTLSNGTFINDGSAVLNLNATSLSITNGTFTPSNSSGAIPTITVSGALNMTGGSVTTSTTAQVTYNLGNLAVSGGTFTMSSNSGSNLAINTLSDLGVTGSGTMVSTSSGHIVVTCIGNFLLNSSSTNAFQFQNSSSSSKTYTLNVGGNFNVSSGRFVGGSSSSPASINFTNGLASVNYTADPNLMGVTSPVNVKNNFFVKSGKTVTLAQSIIPASSSTSNNWSVTVETGGILDCGTYEIGNANAYTTFAMQSGATLITAHAGGVWKNAASQASVTTTSANTSINSGANFIFNGSSAQVTSAFTTTTDPQVNNFTFANTSGVTFSKSFQANGTVTLSTDGLVYLNGFNLTLGTALASVVSPGAGMFSAARMIVADAGTVPSGGYLIKKFNPGVSTSYSNVIFPIGDVSSPNGTQYSPANISFTVSGAITGAIGFNVKDDVHPNNSPATDYITRYWNVYNDENLSGYSFTGSFTYTGFPADIVGTEANYKLNNWYPAFNAWEEYASSSALGNVVTLSSAASKPSLANGRQITARANTPLYYYRSLTTGPNDWNTASSWEVSTDPLFISPAPVTATVPPSYLNSLGIWIRSGHTITVAADATADQMQVAGTLSLNGGTFTVYDGTGTDVYDSTTGRINVNSGTTKFVSNASSTLQIDGYWYNQVTSAFTDHFGTYTVAATGTFENAANGGTIIPATWTSGSPGAMCYITGNTSSVPGGLGQNFYNFKWEAVQTANVGLGLGSLGMPMIVYGDMTVANTGAGPSELRLFSQANGGTLQVFGNLYCTGGILVVQNSSTPAAVASSGILTVYQNISLSGGRLYIAGNNSNAGTGTPTLNAESNVLMSSAASSIDIARSGGSSNGIFNVKGDFAATSGTVLKGGSGTGTVNFIKPSGVQGLTNTGTTFNTNVLQLNIGNGTTTNTINLNSGLALNTGATSTITVYDKATLNCGTYTITGYNFTLNSGGTLGIGSPYGITNAAPSGTSGNVQTGNLRTFSTGGNYVYNGSSIQNTGNALPNNTTITGYVTIANTGPATVTLTNNDATSPYTSLRTLNLNSGKLSVGTGKTLYMDGTTAGPVYATINENGGDFESGTQAGNVYFRGPGKVISTNQYFPNFYDATLDNNGFGLGVDFTGNATINHQLQINSQGFVNPNAPKYATGSTLLYNPGGSYNRSVEWGNSAGLPGYPWHVTVQNTTTLNLGAATPPVLEIGGDMTIGTGTSNTNIVSMNSLTQPLIINGSLVIGNSTNSGNELQLSTAIGGDLYLYRDFSRYNNNSYTDNSRAIYFKGSNDATISTPSVAITPGVPTQYFSYARFDKTNGTENISLNAPVGIYNEATFTKGIINSSSTNLLVFETGAVVNGTPGITSYINGPAAKKMNAGTLTEFVFPLGKSTGTPVYNPAGVKPVALGNATQFNAEYFVNPYPNQSVMGTSLLGITGKGYWDISNTVTSGNTARVKLYYTNPGTGNWIYYTGTSSPVITSAVNPCSYCNVAVVHRDPTTTWNFTSGSSNFNSVDPEWRYYADQGFIYSHNPMSSFERFSIAFSYNVILPVHLLSFNGTLQSNDGLLRWTVADAQGLAGFELQHSHDGRSFYRLSDVSPNSNNSYSYLHKQLQTGAHFYRLKMIEKNGDISFSNVVLLTIGKLSTNIIGLKENPVYNNASVLITSASNQQVYASIGDALGRIISSVEGNLQAGQNQWNVHTNLLARGIYFIQLQTADGVKETIRFVKD